MIKDFLLEKIDYQYNENLICELKKNNLPIVLYGGGGYTMKVIEYLSDNNIYPECCFVDDKYFSEARKINSIPVICFSDFVKRYNACNVVYSINTFSEKNPARETLNKILTVTGRRVFFFELEYIFDRKTEKEIDGEYLRNHITDFDISYNLLADEESKNVMLSYLRAKTGLLNCDNIPHISEFWKEDQYFNSLIQKSDLNNTMGVFVDCGAFDGDTVETFAKKYDSYEKIIAFEPDSKNYLKLSQKQSYIANLECIQKGVWDRETELSFVSDGTSAARIIENTEKSNDSVSVTSVDNILKGSPATFIKMDIEGSELKALHGCSETITTYMPFLAICVYHKRNDLIDIPKYIESLAVQNHKYYYNYYLRHHSYFTEELVLYAVPKKRS